MDSFKNILLSAFLYAVWWLGAAWTLMLGVGVIHAVWLPHLPTLGYVDALKISAVAAAGMILRVGWSLAVKKVVEE